MATTGGFGLWRNGSPFVAASDARFNRWRWGSPYLAGPFPSSAGNVYVEAVTTVVVLAPSRIDRLSAIDKRTATLVILPTVLDVYTKVGQYIETVLASLQITVSSPTVAQMVDKRTSPIVVVPLPRDVLTVKEHPVVFILVSPLAPIVIPNVDRTSVTVRLIPAVADFLRVTERVLSRWNVSSEALLHPQQAQSDWESSSAVKETDAADNIGTPGQTYQVGGASRGVSSESGRRQVVGSEVKVS